MPNNVHIRPVLEKYTFHRCSFALYFSAVCYIEFKILVMWKTYFTVMYLLLRETKWFYPEFWVLRVLSKNCIFCDNIALEFVLNTLFFNSLVVVQYC